MDDYNSNLLNDSNSEWSIRLMNILSGHIIDGFRSIFSEAMEVCQKNDEAEKYLMTFQNYLSMIPKWNQNVVDAEVGRIKESSKCKYLEDLITCVHILQLKILSCVRTGNQNKKIDIDIPCFKTFLHNVYINIARKLYSNIYLFQIDVTSLQQQKHNREFEIIVQSCLMNTIRDNIPVEQLLKQYIDETQEVDVEKVEKIIEKPSTSNENTEENKEDKTSNVEKDDSKKTNVVNLNDETINNPPIVDDPPTIHDMFKPNTENKMETEKTISFDDDLSHDERITIGDNVPLVVDGNFDEVVTPSVNDIEEVTLNLDNDDVIQLDDGNKISDPPIDLGIEELAI